MSTEQPVVNQPVVQVYPNSVTNQPSSHSNGSFGSVFIVLAVIVVISAIACFLGRLCNRRYKHSQPKDKKSHGSKHKDVKPKNTGRGNDRDIEFGFDDGFNPTAKQFGNGGGKGFKPGGNAGEIRGEPRFTGEWEGKAGQY
ncbi:hypothetical protein Vadar_007247 [Vaccinium darrowii]|uniref:Uncharacterized protein n=1 Tax=Vaccinium darrowii TaxID=229202 RepID=A0ACB7WYG4_9ERIC|nr:hypothetical protein Vadar_007247 [Vaccinium darrowii]